MAANNEDQEGRPRPDADRQGPRQAGPRPRGAPEGRQVVVENLNMVKRHTKPRPMRDPSRMGGTQMMPGGVIERPAAVAVSNVMLVCPVCKRPTRVGYDVKDARASGKVRVCRRADCGQEIDR